MPFFCYRQRMAQRQDKSVPNIMKIKNIAETVLNVMAEIISESEIIFSRESLNRKLYRLQMKGGFDQRYLNRSLKRFESQGMLKRIKDRGQDYYQLTEVGLKKIAELRLDRSFKLIDRKGDGLWRLVIFDIPEEKKAVREGLRAKLKRFGFYPLQKSVYASPYACEKEIEDLADFFELGDNIETLLVKSLGRKEKDVRQYFESLT